MDITTIENSVKKLIGRLYLSRFPSKGVVVDVPDFDARMARLRSFQRRLRGHYRLMNQRHRLKAQGDKMRSEIDVVRDAIAAGQTFMAFDVERTMTGLTKEVGVTMWKNGNFRSFNYRVEGMRLKIGFAFGNTKVIPESELAAILVAHAEVADAYVGHSLATDLDHLKSKEIVLPFRRVFDTFWLADSRRDLFGVSGNRRLEDLAAQFGVKADRPHNGGNDARYTMEVLLAMAASDGVILSEVDLHKKVSLNCTAIRGSLNSSCRTFGTGSSIQPADRD